MVFWEFAMNDDFSHLALFLEQWARNAASLPEHPTLGFTYFWSFDGSNINLNQTFPVVQYYS
eukprot:1891-Eustigmatos_ZCMA.PRE.1